MFKNVEVVTLMSHLVVTLAILALYGVAMVTGKTDPGLQNLLFLAGGFWFGAVGSQSIKNVVTKNKQAAQTADTANTTDGGKANE